MRLMFGDRSTVKDEPDYYRVLGRAIYCATLLAGSYLCTKTANIENTDTPIWMVLV